MQKCITRHWNLFSVSQIHNSKEAKACVLSTLMFIYFFNFYFLYNAL